MRTILSTWLLDHLIKIKQWQWNETPPELMQGEEWRRDLSASLSVRSSGGGGAGMGDTTSWRMRPGAT
ncbi:hypothetical protein SAY86_025628 [Trapa natans]|uniref:Uncharacterized protein n=1 Tax=Trapa natans TaxID=22666 RepID=A0AAN7QE23_TRANT|nr:hypothetical protein SAY86_025628 [Trapa natans]